MQMYYEKSEYRIFFHFLFGIKSLIDDLYMLKDDLYILVIGQVVIFAEQRLILVK